MKNKIKICYVIDSLEVGGAIKLTIDVIKLLDPCKFFIGLVILNKSLVNKGESIYDIPKYINVYETNFSDISIFKRIIKLRNIFVNYDIIHSCLENSNFYCSLINILIMRKKIFISTSHGEDGVFIEDDILQTELKKKKYLKYKLKVKYLQTFLFKYYDRFFAVCDYVKKYLVEKRSINTKKIAVLYHGINFNKYNNDISKNDIICLKRNLNINKEDFVISYFGRLSYGKGLFEFVNSIDDILKLFFNVKILFVGDGELKETLKDIIRKKEHKNRYIFKEYQKDLSIFYLITDVFILSSSSESTSMVVQEAMYQKTIVLSSKVGGIPEIIEDGYNGFLFTKGEFNEMKEKLIYIYNNQDLMNNIKINARNTIKENFDLKKNVQNISKEIIKLYEK